MIGVCKVCGKEFTYFPSNSDEIFCSQECYHKWFRGKNHAKHKEKIRVTCEQCGKELLVHPSITKTKKFCSKDCRHKWDSGHSIGKNNPNWKGGDTERVCQWCGKPFTAHRWKSRKFCSHACHVKAQGLEKRTRFHTCTNCGRLFYGKRSSEHSKYFCSKKCEGEYNKGENNPFYKGEFSEKALRKIIKARHARPNRAEGRFISIIKRHNLPFRYVGNGEVIIGGKNPDFIHTQGERKVIELFGIYWHSPLYRKVKPTMTYEAIIQHYAKHGYDCLVIWDIELKNVNGVVDRIIEFIGGIKCYA